MNRTITLPADDARTFLKELDAPDSLIAEVEKSWHAADIAVATHEHDGEEHVHLTVAPPTGVMVGWFLPRYTAEMIAVPGGEPMQDLHLTLAYLGKADAMSADDSRKLVGIVGEVCNRHLQLTGTLNGFGRFTAKVDSTVEPLWVGVNLPGLLQLQADLAEAIKASGLPLSEEYDYHPHITVAYVDKDRPTPSVTVAPVGIILDALTVAVGPHRYTLDLVPHEDGYMGADYVATAYLPDLTKAVQKQGPDRYTLGPWYVPNQLDAHGEWTDPDSLQKALWGYVESGDRDIRLQHDRSIVAGRWVEAMSWPFEVEVPLTKADGTVTKYKYPAGTPFLGVQWEPWAWELVEKGLLRGYSIGGTSDRLLVDLPAEKDAGHCPAGCKRKHKHDFAPAGHEH